VRLTAATELSGGAEQPCCRWSRKRSPRSDPAIKPLLELIQATLELQSSSKDVRVAAVRTLGLSSNLNIKTLLLSVMAKSSDGSYVETDEDVRIEAQKSLRAVEGRLVWGERAGQLFSGISLGSILLLAALGLAITYGIMGVINMAHGELIMIGAYTTYVIQNLFRAHLPGLFDWYLLVRGAGFVFSRRAGRYLARTRRDSLSLRRPLETLLATWGISLFLMQTVRTTFGAQNVQVENPVWMSGGLEIMSGVVLPYSRIVIIFFAAFVVLLMWLLLTRTRLGCSCAV
jgi:urea transport system permease protein